MKLSGYFFYFLFCSGNYPGVCEVPSINDNNKPVALGFHSMGYAEPFSKLRKKICLNMTELNSYLF